MLLSSPTRNILDRGTSGNSQPLRIKIFPRPSLVFRSPVLPHNKTSKVFKVRSGPETDRQQKPTTPSEAPSRGNNNSQPGDVKEVIESTPVSPPKKTYQLSVSRSWVAILSDKIIDAVDDVGLHFKRFVRDLPTTTALQRITRRGDRLVLEADKPVVLVLGSGWGAHSLIKVIDTDAYEVVCISPTNSFLFTPMLPSTAVGTVEFRSLLEPIRIANPFVNYFEARCDKVDLNKKIASCTSAVSDSFGSTRSFDVPYDVLVVSVGERPASFGVPGVEEHCFFMKEVRDAVDLRKRIQEVFELASLPGTAEEDAAKILNFIVVGGGPTGTEFCGALSNFLRQDLRRKYPELMRFVRVTLLQSAQTILTMFDSQLVAIAMQNLENIGVEVRTGVRVTEVTADQVVLSTGEKIDYGVCVWSAGNAPRQLVKDIADALPQQAEHAGPSGKVGKLAVDPFLRVIGARDVIALGDCSKIVSGPLPPTAQVAGQQGAYVAHVINRKYRLGTGGEDAMPPWKPDEDLSIADRVFGTITDTVASSVDDEERPLVLLKKPFEFLNLGTMVSIGNSKAIMEVVTFDRKVPVWGNPAYLLYRAVYLTKQVSFRNRVLILFDWLKTRVFGRDLSQF